MTTIAIAPAQLWSTEEVAQEQKPELRDTIIALSQKIHWGARPWTPLDTRFIENYCRSHHPAKLFIARKNTDQSLLGYAIMRPHHKPTEAYLAFIGTINGIPNIEKRQGLGSALLEAAIHSAEQSGYQQLSLECDADIAGFYKKFAEKRIDQINMTTQEGEYSDQTPKATITYTFLRVVQAAIAAS